ncbi:MAG: twin-arginine translocase subunit TatC [Bacteroidales bacterium]|nr:twin-arginine translocase subunit TatC [Bacteroidales bacterium]
MPDKANNEQGLTFWGHLDVLRTSLFHIVIALVICMAGGFIALQYFFDSFVLGPTHGDFFLYRWLSSVGKVVPFAPDFSADGFHVDIININVASQFMVHMTTAFWLALLLAFPYVLYELWAFIRPALYPKEKKNVGTAFFFGAGMFYLGCAVGYTVVFPFTFRFLTTYQLSAEITNQISLNSYMSNFLVIIFIMGVVFEIPLLAWVLSQLGLISRPFLREYRKHAVVVLLILAAVITPSGDPFTLAVVFIPLFLLYELAILVVRPGSPESGEDPEPEVEDGF